MSLIKFIRFDIKNGIMRRLYVYLVYSLFIVVSVWFFQGKLHSYEIEKYSIGDCLLFLYGGAKEYVPKTGEVFEMPYLWLVNHLLILYFTLNYTDNDLTGFGQQLIYRSGGRVIWWLSKCIWNIIMVSGFYIIGIIITLLLGINNAEFTLDISEHISYVVNFGDQLKQNHTQKIALEILLLPILYSVAISLLQMSLTLLFKPIFSYIVSSSICLSSAYKLTPILIGNFSMAARNDKIVNNGVSSALGIISFSIIIILSVIIGVLIIRKCNILNKE